MSEMEMELAAEAADLESLSGAGVDDRDRPSWLPENFNSPEALVESYRELQRTLTERGRQP